MHYLVDWMDPLELTIFPKRYAQYREFRKQGNSVLKTGISIKETLAELGELFVKEKIL